MNLEQLNSYLKTSLENTSQLKVDLIRERDSLPQNNKDKTCLRKITKSLDKIEEQLNELKRITRTRNL